jgi:hypothetical protein
MKILLATAPDAVITIDDDDLALFSTVSWQVKSPAPARYVQGRLNGTRVYLHRLIMNAPKGLVVDHIDGNGLNNTRANLRVVTQQQNMWNKRRRPLGRQQGYFRVTMRVDGGRRIHLGLFDDETTAKQARVYVERIIRGDFAINDGVDLSGFNPIHLSASVRKYLAER